MTAGDRARAARDAQGFGPTVTDEAVLSRIAQLLTNGEAPTPFPASGLRESTVTLPAAKARTSHGER